MITLGMYQISEAQLKDVENQLRQFRVNRNLFFNYDFYQFAAPNPDSSRLHIIVSIVNDLLQFVKKSDSLYVASFELTFTITESSDQLISDKTFRRSISANNYEETNSLIKSRSYYYGLDLSPGKYQLLLELTDLDIRKSLKRKKEFEIQNLNEKSVGVSDPTITSEILPDSFYHLEQLAEMNQKIKFEEFIQNSRLLAPVLIGEKYHYQSKTPLKIYNEFYQEAGQDSLIVQYLLKNNRQEIVWEAKKSFFSSNQKQFHNTIQINTSDYSPGLYKLNISASRGDESQNKEIRIYFNRKISRDMELVKVKEFSPMRHILTQDEYKYFASFEKSVRDSLIEEFWHERDPTRSTVRNELREEFILWVHFANVIFLSLLVG